MHLLKPGLVDVGNGKGNRLGLLLLTEHSLFVLALGKGRRLGMHGGLIGALLGKLFDSRQPPGPTSPLNDPEVQGLPSAAQNSVRGTEVLAKIRYADMSVTNTLLGFKFSCGDSSVVTYSGYFRKKGIRRFLKAEGLDLQDS
jgi:hypothetical protein